MKIPNYIKNIEINVREKVESEKRQKMIMNTQDEILIKIV